MMAAAAREVRTCAALLLILSLAACGNAPQRAVESTGESVGRPGTAIPVPPPRSDRGNPPFYDVLGKRYHVLPTSAGYVERGVASWYGRDFHGLATSSGERYDMHEMTAAHTRLPLPTWVEVTNLANGKRVVVKVNDRGPFVDNRLIDLSFAAATELDMVRAGTTRVEVRVVAPPRDASRGNTTVAAVAAPAEPPVAAVPAQVQIGGARAPATERMFVQIGAFAQPENAERLAARLRASGFANSSVVNDSGEGRRLHRVLLGPIADSVEFDQVSARLRAIGVSGSRLVVNRAP
jgi:rare lipoprotein A